jgi:hypothetical protein
MGSCLEPVQTVVGPGLGHTFAMVARHGHDPKKGLARQWPDIPPTELPQPLDKIIPVVGLLVGDGVKKQLSSPP